MKRNWEIKKLEEICKVDWGNTKLTKLIYKDSGNPVFSASGQDGYADFYEHEGEAVILSAIGAQAGKVFFASGKWTAIKNTIIIKPIDKEVNARFVFYFLSREKIWKRSGSGQPFISLEAARKQSIILPPFPIQQKIVKILDTIQEAIDIQEKTIEKTKELKKSLMAELFKYGGPSFRKGRKLKKTEIGEIPEDWEVVRLGDKKIAEIKYGKGKPQEDGKIPVIGSSGIYDWTNKALIEKPTIVIGRKGTAGIPHLSMSPCWPSDTAFYLDLNLEKINPKFLYEYIIFRPLSGKHAKTTLPSLKREDLESLKFPLSSLPEQREIAEILQTIDQKIEIEKKKKELYEELFKTMLNKIMNQEIDVEKMEV
jgi:restriction endonuclease S subunit